MPMIPKAPEQQIAERIYHSYEVAEDRTEQDRGGLYLGRLGASSIGEECPRKLWLDWRGYARPKFSGRMLRLFQTGHLQETRVVADLRAAGLTVWDVDPDGRQFEFTDVTGHLVCKVDGVVKGVPESSEKPHVLEVKTHNQTSFNAVVKHGVIKHKPLHYAQMQVGMMLSGLTRALYVSICKNDEQYDLQRVRMDRALQSQLQRKVITLVEARLRPAGISDDPTSFSCKFCDMLQVCYGQVEPLRHCRTCEACNPVEGGVWWCARHGRELDPAAQRLGCEDWSLL